MSKRHQLDDYNISICKALSGPVVASFLIEYEIRVPRSLNANPEQLFVLIKVNLLLY
jgi:hypothetical protein